MAFPMLLRHPHVFPFSRPPEMFCYVTYIDVTCSLAYSLKQKKTKKLAGIESSTFVLCMKLLGRPLLNDML